jgi:ferric-dicitrate binding protein FerR (iron transport regulator)
MVRGTRMPTAKLSLLAAASAIVCLGQVPFSDAAKYAAQAVSVQGQVSILKDSQPWAISVGDSVQVQQLILTGPDGQARFQVSDGSFFDVYPNSRVVFRKNPGNWKDLIDLLVGRVRVHIEHFGNVPNPNRILTPTAVISVRGTTFDVSVDDDDETTEVDVEEGTVEVDHALLPRGNPATLHDGESIRVYRSQPLAQSNIDKGAIARQVLRAVMDGITTLSNRGVHVGSTGGATGGSIGLGDTGKTAPPPTTPPPAPPPLTAPSAPPATPPPAL